MTLSQTDIERGLIYMGSRGRDVADLMPLVTRCAGELGEAADPLYIYKYFDIEFTHEGVALMGTGLTLSGESIKAHLTGCRGCIVLCATLSAGADKLIRTMSAYDIAASFVTDCVASSAIESVCDEAEQEMRERLPDRFLTWRFSPGYGDLPLTLQPGLVSLLDAQKRIGLTVTDSLMLVPSKSVTAIIGVSDKELPKKVRGCTSCNMYDSCKFRKGGDHCGA